MAMNEKNVRAI